MTTGVPGTRDPREVGRAHAPWYAVPPDIALERLGSGPDGLTAEDAEARLARVGPNRLEAARITPWWVILGDQFRSVVVLLLLAASFTALVIGDALEAVAIGAVLAINALIGFLVELRARRAMDALLRHQAPVATVIREGQASRIGAEALVPGDVIELEEGDRIPADARLLRAAGVRTSEAALTGESVPVDKLVSPAPDPGTPLPERTSMLYAGTVLSSGRARAVVVATGMETQLGRIGRLVASVQDEATPLEERLDTLGRRLVWVTLAIAAAAVVLGVLRGAALGPMVETGIALAIAAVPEGLPAVATIALAIGLRRMARRNAVVRRLNAVEALGSATVICTDKTGTLTAGELTVTRVATPVQEVTVTGRGYREPGELSVDGSTDDPALDRLLRASALTPRAVLDPDGVRGDPTDAALLVLARKAHLEVDALRQDTPPVGEVPFSSETRVSASFHREDEEVVGYVKGAPEAILAHCDRWLGPGGPEPLTPELRAAAAAHNAAMARDGLRVIGLACARGPEVVDALPRTLIYLGLVGMMDGPAPGVAETVALLREAGIRTVILTGDQGPTAVAVARAVGMEAAEDRVVDGRDLLDEHTDLPRLVAGADVFSRTGPEEKLRVVEALRKTGEIVAMLGDGVNDAAALKRADVGVAMGVRGTDVARETADVVLQDDRFPTVAAAVEEGRVIFDNIRKFVYYLFGCNVAEILVVLAATGAGLPLPLLPLQILWLNLVTDTFPALALAVEPGEPDVMRRPPRDPESGILSRRFVGSLILFALLITAVTLGAYLWALRDGNVERAITIAFMTLALAQLFHLGNARSRDRVLRPTRALANRWAVGAVGLVLALQLLAVYWTPLSALLKTVPLSPGDWVVVLVAAGIPAVVGQTLRGPSAAL